MIKIENDLKEREVLDYIFSIFHRKEAIIIKGARRTGKTSLMKLMAKRLMKEGEKVIFLDMEMPEDREIAEKGVSYLLKAFGRGIYFIDEIHLLYSPASFIKIAVDHHRADMKLICSGSSSIALNMKFKTSLIGRIIEVELFPLSFREFLIFRDKKHLANLLPQFSFEKIDKVEIPQSLFEEFKEYLRIGGYPEVVLSETDEERKLLLSQFFNLYAKKDLHDIMKLKKETAFDRFFFALASTNASLLNLSELSREIGVSVKTLQNYLKILEGLFLVKLCYPYARKLRKEIRSMPKVYFVDTGFVNWATRRLNGLTERDMGILLENYVFISLLRKRFERVNFWRKKTGIEVDFIVQERNIIPVEVKWRYRKGLKNLSKFMKEYDIKRGFIFSFDEMEKIKEHGKEIHILPSLLLA